MTDTRIRAKELDDTLRKFFFDRDIKGKDRDNLRDMLLAAIAYLEDKKKIKRENGIRAKDFEDLMDYLDKENREWHDYYKPKKKQFEEALKEFLGIAE